MGTVDDGRRRLKSVDRAFEIIAHLKDHGPSTLSEVADTFDLPVSTAHIHLVTLVENDYVIRRGDEYRCSLRFLRTGAELRDRNPLFRIAKPEIDDLQENLGEVSNIGTEEDDYMVQLYKSVNENSIDDNAPLAAHMYLHSTGTGKAMLSQFSPETIDRVVDRRGLPAVTSATITDREVLERELEEIRERGYSINNGEHFAGVRAVAVSILSKRSDVLGAISVSGPTSRIDRDRIEEEIVPELFNKKNIIELKLKQH